MGTIVDLKKALVAEGVAMKLSGHDSKPPFGVQMTEVAGAAYRALLPRVSACTVKTSAALDIALKRAAVAEGKALGLGGRTTTPPFGVVIAAGRGDRINLLLRRISVAPVIRPAKFTPASLALYCHEHGQPAIYTEGANRWQGIVDKVPGGTLAAAQQFLKEAGFVLVDGKLHYPAGVKETLEPYK